MSDIFYSEDTVEQGYDYLLRLDSHAASEYSWIPLIHRMHEGKFSGGLIWGMNPACSGSDSVKTREALDKLDWMVNVNLFQCETSDFWKGPGMDSKKIKTETFYIPCASAIEKDGSVANSGRWMQWRYKGPKLPRGFSRTAIIFTNCGRNWSIFMNKREGSIPTPLPG
jgi:formate dehydrogenase major subunit